MNIYDLKRLAEILAIQAEIEGMKAENLQRESQGHSIAYGEDAFAQEAENLRYVAAKHDEQL